jgi:S1-C subfamily serine protease
MRVGSARTSFNLRIRIQLVSLLVGVLLGLFTTACGEGNARPTAVAGSSSPAPARTPLTSEETAALDQIAASIVEIRAGPEIGSGFVLGQREDEALVLSSAQVVQGSATPQVILADGTTHEGRVLARDDQTDLALVGVAGVTSVPPLRLEPDHTLEPTQLVYLVTTTPGPQGGGLSSARPIHFAGRLAAGELTYIRLDLALSPRSRGAPLVGTNGDVRAVGTLAIRDAGPDTGRSGYAIPARRVLDVVSRFIASAVTPSAMPSAVAQPTEAAPAGAPPAADGPTAPLPTPGASNEAPGGPSLAAPAPTPIVTAMPATPLPVRTAPPTAVEPALPPELPVQPTPTVERSEAARPTTTASASPSLGPTETIRQHYALIDARRYDEGYQLMSANLRSLNSPAAYRSWFANKVGLAVISTNLVVEGDQRAVVEAVVDSTDRVGDATATRRVAERFQLVLEGGSWRIASVARLG